MRFTLTATEDPETGEVGWRDSRIPRNSPSYGPIVYPFGLAHDMLEHFAFEHVGDEIMAHGAMYRIRYEGGWYRPESGSSLSLKDFGYEWINLVRALAGDGQLLFPPKTRPLSHEIEEDISSIVEYGQQIVREAYSNFFEDVRADLQAVSERFRAYFRMGYRKCGQRYKIPFYNVAETFNVIAKAFERRAPEYEGQQISVQVWPRECRVKIRDKMVDEYA
jgi:hypothetical protein